jgi:threonine synthase
MVVKEGLKYRIRKGASGVWRYSDMLPRINGDFFSLGEGYTPIRRMGKSLLKLEDRNPSGSYMDRGTAVWISIKKPREVFLKMSGDFSRSISLYATKMRSKVVVSVGKSDDASDIEFYARLGCDLCIECVKEPTVRYGDPYMIEGFKTIAMEVMEQLGDVRGLVVPVESGILLFSIWLGFKELLSIGAISEVPAMIGARIMENGETRAENPIIEFLASQEVMFMDVDPQDALSATIQLTKAGIYPRPISAAAYVAASKIENNYVAILTGSPLIMRKHVGGGSLTSLQRELLEVVESMGRATAYQVWRQLGGSASLQGIYRALNSLAARGLLLRTVSVRGKRRVIYFSVNRN